MMLRLAEGLRLPLGPDDFADYARAMEAARFLVRPRKGNRYEEAVESG